MVLNVSNIQVVLLMIFFSYRVIMVIVVVSLILYNSFDFEAFLLYFNLFISDNFSNDMLMCSPENDTETTHENSDDESETIRGGSDDESEAILAEDPRNSSLIVEVSIQKDWHEQGDHCVKRYGSDDVTITTDSTNYYPNQTVEVKNNDNGVTDYGSKVTIFKPSNANIEVVEGETHIAETDRDIVQVKATFTGDTAIIERGGNTEIFQAKKMSVECDKHSCDISDRDLPRGKSIEFDSPK